MATTKTVTVSVKCPGCDLHLNTTVEHGKGKRKTCWKCGTTINMSVSNDGKHAAVTYSLKNESREHQLAEFSVEQD